jgi:hypothetical protein
MDFSALVLAPCMEVFATSIAVTPLKSQPGAAPYSSVTFPDGTVRGIRGVWASKPVVVETAEGYHSTTQPSLGIRDAEFLVPLKQGDRLVVSDFPTMVFEVFDTNPDGQGGTDLKLRLIAGP